MRALLCSVRLIWMCSFYLLGVVWCSYRWRWFSFGWYENQSSDLECDIWWYNCKPWRPSTLVKQVWKIWSSWFCCSILDEMKLKHIGMIQWVVKRVLLENVSNLGWPCMLSIVASLEANAHHNSWYWIPAI